MEMWTSEQIKLLEVEAEKHDGKCSNCRAAIRVYRYSVNKQMATVLRKMRVAIDETGVNAINFDELDIPYRLGSQRTKMRLHGLIKQVEKNTWLITKKGGDFLRGEPIPKKVVAFRNQVIGHEGGMTTVQRVSQELTVEQEDISEAEARALDNVRTPRNGPVMDAIFIGQYISGLKTGDTYEVVIERLRVGHPVKLITPVEIEYQDIAAFHKHWTIL